MLGSQERSHLAAGGDPGGGLVIVIVGGGEDDSDEEAVGVEGTRSAVASSSVSLKFITGALVAAPPSDVSPRNMQDHGVATYLPQFGKGLPRMAECRPCDSNPRRSVGGCF